LSKDDKTQNQPGEHVGRCWTQGWW